jgi:hypothetical protein
MITNYARFAREIKPRIVMAKAAFKRRRLFFTSKLDLFLRKKLVMCYIWSAPMYRAELGYFEKYNRNT